MSAYQSLEAKVRDIVRLREVLAIAQWDEACMMPHGGGERRGQALATLKGLIHERTCDPSMGDLLGAAETESLDDWQRANVRQIRREWIEATAVPGSLVHALAVATSQCEQVWREARAKNDWKRIEPLLSEVVKLGREHADALAAKMGLERYDALLETYEPDLRSADVDAEFDRLKTWLPSLLDEVLGKQQAPLPVEGPFPVAAQAALCERVMHILGFDFDRGRFDVSHHPFCGGVPDDTRITTRYSQDGFLESLGAICHETGHALYQQGLPVKWRDQPVGDALGAAVHESQSLLMELHVCSGRDFIGYLAPMIREQFGKKADDAAWSAENLYRHATQVERSFIRVEADEITYPLHVILRYELERQMLDGSLPVSALPEAWDAAMQRYLKLPTGSDYANGCMQDVHWFAGLFGYFPTYTLGAMTAAQWFYTARAERPDLLSSIAAGNLQPLLDWLRANIHTRGRSLTMQPLVEQVTGSRLDASYFERHLRERFLGQ